ncbi:MAG TPA: WD40 repeat domain-containing protein, partial [Gemmataceae bacterium]|nr:WD40 repeat domain-containing protein [Gemmataceae bacterium]
GLALSAGVVAAALSRGAAPAAVPASLTAASVAAPVPAPVTALAEGVLRAMWWNKWKMPAILCTALLLAAGLGRAVLPAAPPAPEQRAPSPPPPVADVKKEPAAAKTFPLGKDVRRVVWSPDGKLMASQALRSEPRKDGGEGEMDWFSTVRVWDAATGKEVTSLGELKNSGLISIAFSPDGATLALSFFRQIEEGTKFELWDARKGELKKTFEMDYGRVVPRVAFAPDGKTLAVLYAGDTDRDRKLEDLNGGVRLFDVTTGKAVRTIRGHKHMAICLAFSPDGKLLATGGSQNDNDIRVWDVATGKELHRIETDRAVQAVAFSPDGKVLLGGEGARGTIASWDVVSGKRLRSLKYVMDDILTLTFSHDGKFLAVAYSEEKDAKRRVTTSLIDMAVGGDDRVTDPVGRWDDTTASLAFTADGRQLAILGRDGTLSLWDVKGLRKPAADPKADYGFGKLIDQLIEAKKTDNEVAEALYLAVLGCYPEERERKFVAGRLAEHKDRREAMVDTVWLLINSKEFWAHLDVLKEHDSREAFKKE